MTFFVKMLGSSDWPMPNEAWGRGTDDAKEVRFAPRPKPTDVTRGDGLIYYAVGGYKRVFAAVRVEGSPALKDSAENPEVAKRWPYAAAVSVDPTTKLKYVSSGPALQDVGRGLQAKVGHGVGYFEIGRPEFDRAVQLLRAAKKEEDKKLKAGWKPT